MMRKSARYLAAATVVCTSLGFGSTALASEPFIGQIQTFGFNFAPRGWAHCNGQLLSIASNTALFSLLGTTFGGDGRTTFALPDLRGRAAVHPGSGPGLSNITWGQRGGSETRILSVSNLPSHNHTATLHATSTNGNQTGPANHILANDPREDQYSNGAPNVTMNAASVAVGNTGGGQSFSIRDPYLGIYHSIALTGVYPSRN